MSKHVSYRGVTIDMDSIRRDNKKTLAMGNMQVNARGDQIKNGQVTKSAEEIARENHRVVSAIKPVGIKGDMPEGLPKVSGDSKKQEAKKKQQIEKELSNGDIVIQDEDGK